MKLLCVDDDADDVSIFCEAVKEINPEISCSAAYDGEEALSFLTSNISQLPVLIFLDINMPRIDGIACLKLIRQNPLFDSIKIYMHSTSASPKDILTAKDLNATFLIKPSSYQTLVKDLEKVISENLIVS
jgi:CheY-like chemotaxis protein